MIVACVGFPRSGSTLQYNIVKKVIEVAGYNARNLGYLEKKEQLLKVSEDNSDFIIFKSHEIDEDLLANARVYVVHSYRDLRDCFLSAKLKWNMSLEMYCSQTSKFINEYSILDRANHLCSQKYENSILDRMVCTEELTVFFGFENKVSDSDIKAIVCNTSIDAFKGNVSYSLFDKLRHWANLFLQKFPGPLKSFARKIYVTKLIRFILPTNVQDQNTLVHMDHISRNQGRVNVWKQQLNDREITTINNNYRDWLLKNGYEV